MSAVRAIAECDLAHSPSQSIIQKPISARDNRTRASERVENFTNISGMNEQTKRIAQQKFHLLYHSLWLCVFCFSLISPSFNFFFVHFHFMFSMSILNVLMVAQFTLTLYSSLFLSLSSVSIFSSLPKICGAIFGWGLFRYRSVEYSYILLQCGCLQWRIYHNHK